MRVYHRDKSNPRGKWHKVGVDEKDDRQNLHDPNRMNDKVLNSFDPPPRSQKAKTGEKLMQSIIMYYNTVAHTETLTTLQTNS